MTLTQTTLDHRMSDFQTASVEGPSSDRHGSNVTHGGTAVGLLSSSHGQSGLHDDGAAGPSSLSQALHGIHRFDAQGPTSQFAIVLPPEAAKVDARAGDLFNGYLCLLSDSLDDIEGLRIATENRVRMLTRSEADSDGEVRGLGMDIRSPEVGTAVALLDGITQLEHDAELALKRQFRKHPLHPFVKAQIGLGDKQTARLLAVIGDPYWNDLHGRPRTVSELWAYCGYAVNAGRAQRRAKGAKANWSPRAKARAFLIAQSCIKQAASPYRAVYDDGRAKYADATHPHECVRCGPAGRPAPSGTPLSAGHQHQRALRLVSKTILRDLWDAARTVHEGAAA